MTSPCGFLLFLPRGRCEQIVFAVGDGPSRLEQAPHFGDDFGILIRDVVALREVFFQVIEFPGLLVLSDEFPIALANCTSVGEFPEESVVFAAMLSSENGNDR